MPAELIKYAFSGGELSPNLIGRSDLEKFDLGLKLAYNWFVDYHGGLSTRPGTEFIDFVEDDAVFYPFKFNSDIANTYLIIFGPQYIRFIQDGGYVLEADKTINSYGFVGTTTVTTAAAHGYSDDNWVKIGGQTFRINVTSPTEFEIYHPYGAVFTGTLTATVVNRIYTVTTAFSAADLPNLRFHQRLDTLRITIATFPVIDLTRIDHTNWTFANTVFGALVAAPGGLFGDPIQAGDGTPDGTYGFVWTVTAVDRSGVESGISGLFIEDDTNNFAAEAGGYEYGWNNVVGAAFYNVYRSNIVKASQANRGLEVGFIGRVYGTRFSELNIVPDFTQTPPVIQRVFVGGQILGVDVTTGGSGYDGASTVTVTGGGGSGFQGYPIVDAAGAIVGVFVQNGGQNFATTPSVNFTGGTGAVATTDRSPMTGERPTISGRFQQRDIYAATLNEPLTIWGSRTGQTNNFNTSRIPIDSDAFTHTIDSDELTPIRHVLSMRSGLLIMTDYGVWQLTGGGINDAVTPSNALADPHSYVGVSKLPPIRVDTDILYQEAKGAAIRQLSYNELSKVYGGIDVSILSSHFFDSANQLTSWSYADAPFKVIWGVRADGALLCFTVVREQNVYAWTQNWTKGYFQYCATIQENNFDRTYVLVERFIDGYTIKMIERLHTRKFSHVEDAWCVDSGLSLAPTYPAASLECSAGSGSGITFTVGAAVFTSGDVGKVLRVGGGKAEITAFTDSTHLIGTFIRPMTDYVPETTRPISALEGEWTLDTPVNGVGGLYHLEGETVSILADGNAYSGVVTNGAVSLPNPLFQATRFIIGLPFVAKATTLPLTVSDTTIEGRRKRVSSIAFRLNESRGVLAGRDFDHLYIMKERTDEPVGEPTNLVTGIKPIDIAPDWTDDGSICFQVSDPLPATVLGLILDTEIGDDKD